MPPERKRKSGQGAIAAGPAHGKAPKLEDYLKGNRPQHEFNQLRRDLNRSCWVFFIIILWEGVIKDYLMFLEKAFPVPDDAGVEKLAITAPVGGMVKQRPPFTCQDLFPHFPNCKEVVGPMGCLFVKGWTRSVAATCVMEYADLGSFQSALTIGKSEAAAAWNLVKEIEYPITETLCRLVQVHSQPKFIYHEPLAGGLFNREYNSGQGQYTAWQEALQNNLEVVKLMVQRMQAEFESTPVKFRKPWSLKDVDTKLELVVNRPSFFVPLVVTMDCSLRQ
ncbi:Uncharacterized protein SCF082_LOCUS34243 [Durusdinium trenchii]|uniref:Uncharacterized protein n=1 Tax=Durusdinium trenchii TaxID=1381693 RepID=A0ABP0NYH7_9DINO